MLSRLTCSGLKLGKYIIWLIDTLGEKEFLNFEYLNWEYTNLRNNGVVNIFITSLIRKEDWSWKCTIYYLVYYTKSINWIINYRMVRTKLSFDSEFMPEIVSFFQFIQNYYCIPPQDLIFIMFIHVLLQYHCFEASWRDFHFLVQTPYLNYLGDSYKFYSLFVRYS